MLLADTSYLVALFVANDERHARAVEINNGIRDRVFITDQVFSEFITIASKKTGNKNAYVFGKKLLASEMVLIIPQMEDISAALEFVRKYPEVSFCDAVSAAVMQQMGVQKVLSFDSDFDRLGFERIS